MFVYGLVAGIILTALSAWLVLPKVMFIESESRVGFEETNMMIEKKAVDMKWGVPHQYDLQATLKKNGFEVQPVRVISLCKPTVANQILSSGNDRIASALMPCRVSVYVKPDGKTYVSRLNAALFSKFLGKTIRGAMKTAALETEEILAPVVIKVGQGASLEILRFRRGLLLSTRFHRWLLSIRFHRWLLTLNPSGCPTKNYPVAQPELNISFLRRGMDLVG